MSPPFQIKYIIFKAQTNPLRQKKRDSYGIRKDKKTNKAEAALNKSKITR